MHSGPRVGQSLMKGGAVEPRRQHARQTLGAGQAPADAPQAERQPQQDDGRSEGFAAYLNRRHRRWRVSR